MKSNVLALLALGIVLGGCGKASDDSYRAERADRMYSEAQADYVAGRLEAAAKGFAEVLKANPGNASARFQLAVIMQDSLKDYLGALCNYREYVAIAGESDKAEIAESRMAKCEKDFVAYMAQKYNMGDNTKVMKDLEVLRADLAAAEKKLAEKMAALLEADKRIAALEREKQSLSAIVRRMGEDVEDEPARPRRLSTVVKDSEVEADGAPSASRVRPIAKADQNADDASASAHARTRIVKVDEDESERQLTVNPEAMALMQEEEKEARNSSAMLPAQPPKKEMKKVANTEPFLRQQTKSVQAADTTRPVRPDYYVVMPGDTLRKIAVKFYGEAKAWEKIREANKVRVPLSGDIRVGDKLRLP